MRLRRQIFHPRVYGTRERGRPITVNLGGLVFDVTVDEAHKLATDLCDANPRSERTNTMTQINLRTSRPQLTPGRPR
jgi:hypothetical protein